MRYIGFLFLSLIILISISCEQEEEPVISPAPDHLKGSVMQLCASRASGETRWEDNNYVTFFISDDGKYYTMNQGFEKVCEGSINWHMENGKQILEFNSEDGQDDRIFEVIELDENHFMGEIQWGADIEEWIFTCGNSNYAGLVVDASNYEPIENAFVVVNVETSPGEFRMITSTYTDPDGYFGLHASDVAGGELFQASHASFYKENHSDVIQKEINITRDSYFFEIYRMDQGQSSLNFGRVTGTVREESTGNAIAGATISFGDPSKTATTSFDGIYEIMVPEGFQVITVSHEEYESQSENLAVNSLGEYQVDFLLKPAGFSLSGSIIDVEGTGVANAVMNLKDLQGTSLGEITTESDGTFSLEGVADGSYIINVSVPGMQVIPQNYPVDVSGGNLQDIQFLAVNEGTTAIGGRVTNWNDESPEGAVELTIEGINATTNAAGYYLMKLDSSGTRILKAEKSGYLNRYKEVDISSGDLVQKNMKLAPEGSGSQFTFYGTVRDADSGNPISGATVYVEGQGSNKTSTDGTFSIDLEVYDEDINQILMYSCEKDGYETDNIYLFFYKDTYFGTEIYLSKSKK